MCLMAASSGLTIRVKFMYSFAAEIISRCFGASDRRRSRWGRSGGKTRASSCSNCTLHICTHSELLVRYAKMKVNVNCRNRGSSQRGEEHLVQRGDPVA